MADMTEAQSPPVNPWVPMSRPIDLKHLNKLNEELAEALSASSRCLMQGIDLNGSVTDA